MVELRTSFDGRGEMKGFTFSQIKLGEKAYVYKVSYEDYLHYEIFKREERRVYDFASKCTLDDKHVKYPSSNDFGKSAWVRRDYNDAVVLFNKINK